MWYYYCDGRSITCFSILDYIMMRSFKLKIGQGPRSESLLNFCGVSWNFCGTAKSEQKDPEVAVNTALFPILLTNMLVLVDLFS